MCVCVCIDKNMFLFIITICAIRLTICIYICQTTFISDPFNLTLFVESVISLIEKHIHLTLFGAILIEFISVSLFTCLYIYYFIKHVHAIT